MITHAVITIEPGQSGKFQSVVPLTGLVGYLKMNMTFYP